MTLAQWAHHFVRTILITGSPAMGWNISRRFLPQQSLTRTRKLYRMLKR